VTVGSTLSRRTFLGVLAAGSAAVLTGCTSFTDADRDDDVTPAQIDQLAGQVAVQEQLADAYATAFAADPELAVSAEELARQCADQLARLRAAAPGGTDPASPALGPDTAGAPAVTDPTQVRATLRHQVGVAADSHAAACTTFTGARAALLGSLVAGLRGQEQQLA